MIRFGTLSIFCMLLFPVSSQAGIIRYDLNTATTNGDTAILVSGFFETNGTVGNGIRLSDILTDYSVTISELNRTETLLPSNSTLSESLSLFDVTQTEITLPAGPNFFRGLQINTNATGQADRFVRYIAFQTSGTANVFVSINSGAGTLNGISDRALVATATAANATVPEPSTAFAFLAIGALGLVRKRSRRIAS